MTQPIVRSAGTPQVTPTGTLFREVWRIERQIRSERSNYHRIGHDGWPRQELVRFRTSQHQGFAGQDVVEARIQRADDGVLKSELTVNCLGLTGARGALPSHYTELVFSQLKAKAPALKDFLDLFNHRILSLYYRSWEKTQPAVQQERQEVDLFSKILRALTNSETDWEIYYGAALARTARSASTVKAVLSDLTQMNLVVRTLQGGWKPIAQDDQSRLPDRTLRKGQYAHLGEAMLGSRAWIADKGVQIVFYPQNSQQLQSLLPGGKYSGAVAQLTRRLVSGQIHVNYRVVAKASDLMGIQLGRKGRLGADSFIGARRSSSHTLEISFKPSQGKDPMPCHQ